MSEYTDPKPVVKVTVGLTVETVHNGQKMWIKAEGGLDDVASSNDDEAIIKRFDESWKMCENQVRKQIMKKLNPKD